MKFSKREFFSAYHEGVINYYEASQVDEEIKRLKNEINKLKKENKNLEENSIPLNDDSVDLVPDSHLDWLQKNKEKLEQYPNHHVAIDIEEDIIRVAEEKESDYIAKMKALPQDIRRRLYKIHTSMWRSV